MTAPPPSVPLCRVIGAELLPAGLGGAAALCAEIENAVTLAGVSGTTVDVRVTSASLISVTARMPDGRVLPAVKLGVSDRELTANSFRRLASALADQLKASKR